MFEKSAKSSFLLNDERQHPFALQTSINRAYSMILEKIKETPYQNLIESKDYWEIFVARNENLEITYYLIDEKNGSTRVVMLIYTPNHRGKAKKILREMIVEHKQYFEKYLAKTTYNAPAY